MSVPAAITAIHNYRPIDAQLATSGQPNEDQIAAIAAEGVDYIHIPVKFDAPTTQDLHAFFEVMESHAHRRVWVHCAANMRVTAFLGLFRVLRQGYSEERAFEPMHSVWKPNAVWAAFITSQLAEAHDG